MTSVKLQYDDLMNPVIEALKSLGGSGTNEEINNKVAEIAKIPSEQLEVLHNPEKGGMTEIEYRLMWTRTYLKIYGITENSTRGVWSLTEKGSSLEKVDEKDVVRVVREQMKKNKQATRNDDEPNNKIEWQEELLDVILEMSPSAFERLIQRLLRESGFVQVEVTGQSGDGGVDGHGILRLVGLLSFHVIFQAKRWKGAVGAGQVRDFRGAMVGRADKGLLITTGAFTKDAIKEASRDGAPAIDLIDGDQLVEKLKQLSLGVNTKKIEVEQVSIDHKWFSSL
ncbi:MAG: restriction endonuclease [Chloroflexota bacterium]|nr:restriction endonuclease [Chloroflexota bacterium]